MNKIKYEQLIKPLIKIYNDIEIEIIKEILIRLENYPGIQGTLEWYLAKLAEMGTFNNRTLKLLQKDKNKMKATLEEILKNGANYSEYNTILDDYFNKGLLDMGYLELYNSVAINNIINSALSETDDILNLINTKAIEGASSNYKEILTQAYVETASGVYSYDQAIKRALDKYVDKGILAVHYESGKILSIETVVRRDVLTKLNQLTTDVDIQNCLELGTNLVYVDQHLGARTRTKYTKEDYEAHDEWQGKVYMINGSNDKYENLFEKTGLGLMLGLRGINCYHNFRPFFEWEEIPERIDEDENKKKYNFLQKQREYERKIRNLKKKRVIDKELDKNAYKNDNKKYKKINQEYNQFIEENNLNRDYSREYIESR